MASEFGVLEGRFEDEAIKTVGMEAGLEKMVVVCAWERPLGPVISWFRIIEMEPMVELGGLDMNEVHALGKGCGMRGRRFGSFYESEESLLAEVVGENCVPSLNEVRCCVKVSS